MGKALVKSSDSGISFCKCQGEGFATSGQADCPWCGCGWLFTCTSCRKAFTYAKVVSSDVTPAEIIQADLGSFSRRSVSIDEPYVVNKAEWLAAELAELEIGAECVILDGHIIDVSARDVAFDGFHSRLEFVVPPHVEANGTREGLLQRLGDVNYWESRRLPDADDD